MDTDRPSNSRYLALILLTLVYVFNFIDRQIIGVLSPYIQQDLGLSYEQLGLLKGFYFALFYTVVGIPIAWLADRYNRVRIVTVSLTLWSMFTAFSGMAMNYVQLALMRVGVGVGEAGGSPPSHSIISDLFPASERAQALAIYSLGIPIGVMLAYFAAGALVDAYGWRATFIILGVSGVVLAGVLLRFLKEPVRGAAEQLENAKSSNNNGVSNDANESPEKAVNMWVAIKYLLTIPTWWAMCMGITMASFMAYSVSTWHVDYLKPAFPNFDFVLLTTILGLLNGVVYGLGTYFGGYITDKWAKHTIRAYGYVPAIGVSIAFPAVLASYWVDSMVVHLILAGIYLFCIGSYLGPSFSIAQSLAPTRMRAISTALFFFVLNLISLGGGPSLVGFLAGWFEAEHGGTHAIRLSLSMVSISMLLSIIAFLIVASLIPNDWNKSQLNTKTKN